LIPIPSYQILADFLAQPLGRPTASILRLPKSPPLVLHPPAILPGNGNFHHVFCPKSSWRTPLALFPGSYVSRALGRSRGLGYCWEKTQVVYLCTLVGRHFPSLVLVEMPFVIHVLPPFIDGQSFHPLKDGLVHKLSFSTVRR
jgi:hypothetical protein